MINRSFWSQQRVLLTGHKGFKGSWLSLWLEYLGAQVSGVSLAPDTDPNLFSLLGPFARQRSATFDIRDLSATEHFVREADPSIAIHMAAQPLVSRSYRQPLDTFATNVIGTANILESLRACPALKAILVVTTDKVYRNNEDGRAYREDDPLGAHDPYSASKAATELVAGSWDKSFFRSANIPVVTARAGNVIGGGDWAEDRIVPDIWRATMRNETVRLRHPDATRPWQFVLEPLSGYLLYVQRMAVTPIPQKALNFGPLPV